MREANTVHKLSEVCPYCGASIRENITKQDTWRMYTCGTIGSFMDGFYVQGGNCNGPELETAPVEKTNDEKEEYTCELCGSHFTGENHIVSVIYEGEGTGHNFIETCVCTPCTKFLERAIESLKKGTEKE